MGALDALELLKKNLRWEINWKVSVFLGNIVQLNYGVNCLKTYYSQFEIIFSLERTRGLLQVLFLKYFMKLFLYFVSYFLEGTPESTLFYVLIDITL